MLNKQNIWFAFLFSIILILSIFYISMDNSELSEFISNVDTTDTTLVVNESTELVALRIQSDEEVLETINELQGIILDSDTDLQAKNDAYNELMNINDNKTIQEKLEKLIKEEFKYESFVKISGDSVTVVIDSDEHDYDLANDVIRSVSSYFDTNKYVSVKFN